MSNLLIYCPSKENIISYFLEKLNTVFPLISAGPQINAAPLGIHIEISVSPLISITLCEHKTTLLSKWLTYWMPVLPSYRNRLIDLLILWTQFQKIIWPMRNTIKCASFSLSINIKSYYHAGLYLFKVNNSNTRTMY